MAYMVHITQSPNKKNPSKTSTGTSYKEQTLYDQECITFESEPPINQDDPKFKKKRQVKQEMRKKWTLLSHSET